MQEESKNDTCADRITVAATIKGNESKPRQFKPDGTIKEAATEKHRKRGRPDLFSTLPVSEDGQRLMRDMCAGSSQRVTANNYYVSHASAKLEQVVSDYQDIFEYSNHRPRAKGVLEQIGRLCLQDHLGDFFTDQILESAASALRKGRSAKDVEQMIRNIRNAIVLDMVFHREGATSHLRDAMDDLILASNE